MHIAPNLQESDHLQKSLYVICRNNIFIAVYCIAVRFYVAKFNSDQNVQIAQISAMPLFLSICAINS